MNKLDMMADLIVNFQNSATAVQFYYTKFMTCLKRNEELERENQALRLFISKIPNNLKQKLTPHDILCRKRGCTQCFK